MPFPTSGISIVFKEPSGLTDRTGYLDATGQFSWTLTRNQRGSLSLPLQVAPGDGFAPQCGWPVFLYENYRSISSQVCVWMGSLSDIDIAFNAGNEGQHQIAVSGVSAERFFDSIQCPVMEFSDTNAGAIFTALASYAIAQGLPISISLGTIDAGVSISNRKFDGSTSVGAELQRLATDSAFLQYVSPSDAKINFHATDTVTAPFTIQNDPVTGQGMIRFGTIRYKQSDADFRDKTVIQLNADVVPPETATFAGDGGTKNFTLPKPAAQVLQAAVINAGATIHASGVGTFSGQPAVNDTVVLGGATYRFVSTLDNTVFGDVLIGGTDVDTCQNLADAINAADGKGTRYSMPTWANAYATAELAPGALVFTARAKTLGVQGNSVALGKTGTQFSWGTATLTGAESVEGISLWVGPLGAGSFGLYYSPGSTDVSVQDAPATGTSLVVTYRAQAADTITVSNGAAGTLGLGSNFQIIPARGAKTLTAALAQASANLKAYSKLPAKVSYELGDDVPGKHNAMLAMGQLVTHSISAPAEAPALIDGTWILQSITGRIPEPKWQKLPEPFGHFRYSLEFINTLDVSTFQDTLQQLVTPVETTPVTVQPPMPISGGGSGSGSAMPNTRSRDLLLKDLTVADNVIDNVLILTPIIALTSPPTHAIFHATRICAVIREGIVLSQDLVVRINKLTTTTSPPSTASWTVTIPAGSAWQVPMSVPITGTIQDLDILSADITASDGQKDKDGVVSIQIEWE